MKLGPNTEEVREDFGYTMEDIDVIISRSSHRSLLLPHPKKTTSPPRLSGYPVYII